MPNRPRLYTTILRDHLNRHRQMALVAGPRQVGKTTACRALADDYLNWDNADDRRQLLRGPASLAVRLGLDRLRATPSVVVLDELHKHAKWKTLLKGFFDTYGERARILVTGSSRLDVFRRGGDSLMGRYLLYRMHPWSVAESVRTSLPERELHAPAEIPDAEWDALWEHGGFPEPFLRRDSRFSRRWRSLRRDQLSREDIRDLAHITDLGAMDTLMQILAERSALEVPGVVAVRNNLRVTAPPEGDDGALAWRIRLLLTGGLTPIPGRFDVAVKNRDAVLDGEVPLYSHRIQAERLALSVGGILTVQNRLKVNPSLALPQTTPEGTP